MTADGDILVFYRVGSKHVSNDGKVMMVRYRDGVWEAPEVFASDPQYDVRNPICGVHGYSGRIIVMYLKHDAEAGTSIGRFMKYSDDNGKTWTSEIRLNLSGARNTQNSVGNLLYERNGYRRMFYATENEDLTGFTFWGSYNGVTWSKIADFADFSAIGGNVYEPCLCLVPAKKDPDNYVNVARIYCSIRHHQPGGVRKLWITYSDDWGATWSTPRMVPEVKGSNFILFPYGDKLGVLVRDYPWHNSLGLYVTDNPYGVGFHRQATIADRMNLEGMIGYASVVQLHNASVMIVFPFELHNHVANPGDAAGLYYTFVDTTRFEVEPKTHSLYNVNGNLLRGQTVSAGSLTSEAFSVFGYRNKTIYFQADVSGTLNIEVLPLSGTWRTYGSEPVSADSLVVYTIAGEAVLCRVTFTPDSYPATISEAEVVLR